MKKFRFEQTDSFNDKGVITCLEMIQNNNKKRRPNTGHKLGELQEEMSSTNKPIATANQIDQIFRSTPNQL